MINSDINEYVIYAEQPQIKKWEAADIPILIVVSAVLGVITSLHTRMMLSIGGLRQQLARRLRRWASTARIVESVLYGGACALIFSLVSLTDTCTKKGESGLHYVAFNCGEGEYNQIASLLVSTSHSSVKLLFSGINGGEIRASSSLAAFAAYYTLNVGLAGLPVPGGAFTATMLLGGLFGRAMGELCRDLGLAHTVSGVYAVVGSASMLCGFKQMTLASVLIVVECVNDLSLAPLVMLGVAVAISVNWQMNERGHDEEQIKRKSLPYIEGEAPHEFDSVVALQLLDPLPDAAVLPPEATVDMVRHALRVEGVSHYPVRHGGSAGSGPYIGIIPRANLEAVMQTSIAQDCTSHVIGGELRSIHGRTSADGEDDEDGAFDEVFTSLNRQVGGNAAQAPHLALRRVMDPTPLTIVEDMPAPRLHALFANARERAVCVASATGEPRGVISREGLVKAMREGPPSSSS